MCDYRLRQLVKLVGKFTLCSSFMVFTLCIPVYSFDTLLFVNFLLLPCSHFLLILIVNFCVLLFYFLFLFFSCLSGCYFSLVFPVFSHLVSCLCLSLLSSVFSHVFCFLLLTLFLFCLNHITGFLSFPELSVYCSSNDLIQPSLSFVTMSCIQVVTFIKKYVNTYLGSKFHKHA